MLLFNEHLASDLGWDFSGIDQTQLTAIFSGNSLPESSVPISQAYAGHQFGHFTMLGDGRAVILGEWVIQNKPAPQGNHLGKKASNVIEKNSGKNVPKTHGNLSVNYAHKESDEYGGNRYDIQLKGSGITPYSRQGDGRATLRSVLREYLMSEAMHHLGIPTTRSLAVVTTGETVYREVPHEGAVLTRVASSHIRIGTFEYVNRFLGQEELKRFTRYVIKRHYPELMDAENPVLELLKAVANRQIRLITEWMRVGFIHGVMNTDNMSIPGETIDYGPCAFMNGYDPHTVFSSIDVQGRYRFANQPIVAQWNLTVFAGTLLGLVHKDRDKAIEMMQEVIDGLASDFERQWYAMMSAKLGLWLPENEVQQAGAESEKTDQQAGPGWVKGAWRKQVLPEPDQADRKLIDDLLRWMEKNRADYTRTFLALQNQEVLSEKTYQQTDFQHWYKRWIERVSAVGKTAGLEGIGEGDTNDDGKAAGIGRIEGGEGSEGSKLLSRPSGSDAIKEARRRMIRQNPVFIPRNHLVEEALDAATIHHDMSPFNQLLGQLTHPYRESFRAGDFQEVPEGYDRTYQTFCGT